MASYKLMVCSSMKPHAGKLSTRLRRGLDHWRSGTLLDRLRWEWHEVGRRRRRARWHAQQQKVKHFDTRIQSGVLMRLFLDDQLSQFIYCEDFEWQEREFLNSFLGPGDVFVDMGANIGLFTVIAAHLVGQTGQVYGFEPFSKNFNRLLENVQLNGFTNVSCHHTAVADQQGEATLAAPLDGLGAWSSCAHPIAGHQFTTETVAAVPWDQFAQEHDLVDRVTMMKIDVEGWETRVLTGGAQTLARAEAPVLQVEFTEQAARSAGSSCQKLYQSLEGLGYRMFMYDAKSSQLVHDPLRDLYPYVNLFAAKRPEQIMMRLRKRSLWHGLN